MSGWLVALLSTMTVWLIDAIGDDETPGAVVDMPSVKMRRPLLSLTLALIFVGMIAALCCPDPWYSVCPYLLSIDAHSVLAPHRHHSTLQDFHRVGGWKKIWGLCPA